jgi:hypothetical protein
MIAADDKELAGGAALLQKDGSPEAQSLFASLVEGHEINRTSPAEYGNARRRERLMKRLFAANYARADEETVAYRTFKLREGVDHVRVVQSGRIPALSFACRRSVAGV